MTSTVVALLLAQAFYVWTDKAGVEHFTDDRSTIPKGVKVTQTDGAEISTVEVHGGNRAAPAPVVVVAPAETAREKREREDYWRNAFREARNKISDLEISIEANRKLVEEVNGMPITAHASCRNTYIVGAGQGGVLNTMPAGCYALRNGGYERQRRELERDRAHLERAKTELADLERRAANESVPLEWRR